MDSRAMGNEGVSLDSSDDSSAASRNLSDSLRTAGILQHQWVKHPVGVRRKCGNFKLNTLRWKLGQVSSYACTLALVILAMNSPPTIAESRGNATAATAGKSQTNTTSASTTAPIDIYLHKLALILSSARTGSSSQGTKKPGETPLFSEVVNGTADYDYYAESDEVSNRVPRHTVETASTEFQCGGPDCPVAEFLRNTSDAQSSPWPTHARTHRSQESLTTTTTTSKPKLITTPILQRSKLGPLRVFKYVHNPDELTTKPSVKSNPIILRSKNATTKQPPQRKSPAEKKLVHQVDSAHAEPEVAPTEHAAVIPSHHSPDKIHPGVGSNGTSNMGVNGTRNMGVNGTRNMGVNGTSNMGINGTSNMGVNGTFEDGFRPRRSPFRPKWRDHKLYTQEHSREALYQMGPHSPPPAPAQPQIHPPPPGYVTVQLPMSKTSQGNSYMQHGLVPIPNQPGPLRPLVGVPIPMGVPYAKPPHHPVDRNFVRNPMMAEGGPDAESPEEQSTFRLNSYKRPRGPGPKNRPHHHHHDGGRRGAKPRRPPMPRHGPRPPGSGPVPSVMPPPNSIPIPLPMPRPQHLISLGARDHGTVKRRPPPNPQPFRAPPPAVHYRYPKDAANIQDILTYFKTEENEIPGSHSKNPVGSAARPSLSSSSSGSGGGGGISSEFRDVHESLLKDIKNFASRPLITGDNNNNNNNNKDNSREIPPKGGGPQVLPLLGSEDPLDNMLMNVKPKPVRGLRPFESNERLNSREKGNKGSRERLEVKEPSPSSHRYNYGGDDDGDDDDDDDDMEKEFKSKFKPSSSRERPRYPDRSRDHERQREQERSRNPERPRDQEDQEDQDEEDDYRSSDYNRPTHKDRRRNRHDKVARNPKGEDDLYDERPFANSVNADVFMRGRERERHRDYGVETHYHRNNAGKSHRPTKSHKHRTKGRHKSSKSKAHHYFHHDHDNEGNHRHREREAMGMSRERLRQANTELIHSPKLIPMSPMDQAYYRQRNRPVVIKRPYQPYRAVDVKKLEQQRKYHDKYWNSVDVIKVTDNKPTTNIMTSTYARPSSLPQPIQTHYHYYGVGASPAGMSQTGVNRVPPQQHFTSTTRRPVRISPGELNGSMEDILEIHTDGAMPEITSTPIYSYTTSSYSHERDKKADMHKVYMDYLQRKLEAQAEAQAEAMLNQPPQPQPIPTTTPKPKRPMRMKIHIYPNEKVQVVDHTNPTVPQTVYYSNPASPYGSSSSGNMYNNPNPHPTSLHRSYGHYQSPVTPTRMSPPIVISHAPSSPMISSSSGPHRIHSRGPSQQHRAHPSVRVTSQGSQTPDGKGKNVVLHLHVHRRNDQVDSSQLEMAGSETVTSTVKPLTYEDIYAGGTDNDMQAAENTPDITENGSDRPEQEGVEREQGQSGDETDAVDTDKSLSVELPIHQDKIDAVLTTLLKLRE